MAQLIAYKRVKTRGMKTSELTLHLKIWLWSLMGDMMVATVNTTITTTTNNKNNNNDNNNFIEL